MIKLNKNNKIVIFSDLHYAPELPVNNGSRIERKLINKSLEILEKLINEINNNIKPNVVINLGDLVEDFNDHDEDIENLKYILNRFKEIEAPFYSIIGNHDLRSMKSRNEVEEIMEYEHSTFSVNECGLHLVFLGTYVNNDFGNEEGGIYKTQFMSQEDIEWLKQDLKENNLPVLVFLHFGVAEDEMKGNWWFEDSPECALLGNRKLLKEILEKENNLIAVFSGHQHWTKKLVENNVNYYILGSLTENINNDGIPDGVYFEIEVDDKKINVIEKHIRL